MPAQNVNGRLICDRKLVFIIFNYSRYCAVEFIIPLELMETAKLNLKFSTLLPSQHDGHGPSSNSPSESSQRVCRDSERPQQQYHVALKGNACALQPGFIHEHLDVLRGKHSAA